MKAIRIAACLLLTCLIELPAQQSHYQQIKDLLTGDEPTARHAAAALASQPMDSLIGWIQGFDEYPPAESPGEATRFSRALSDTVGAPYWVSVPSGYDPKQACPLVIYLHGGVSRPTFHEPTNADWADHDILKLCRDKGWVFLYPSGRGDLTWWDPAGMEHVAWLIRDVKRRFNIDDDRVALCGFSDGGSGSYHFAMLTPSAFASFHPWSGNMAVGTLVGGMQVYPANLRARPVFATNGGLDALYPAARMQEMAGYALDLGADLRFAAYDTAGHNFGYMTFELPLFAGRMDKLRRDPLPQEVYWETADPQYGRCDWMEIVKLDTAREAAAWQRMDNHRLVDDRVSVGFIRKMDWEGEGMFVESLVEDTASAAYMMGLQPGDILIRLDSCDLKTMDDYLKWRESTRRGNEVEAVVRRGDDLLTLKAKLPPSLEYDAFPHKAKSGAVRARRLGNSIRIETSRVASVAVYLCPEMVRYDQPVEIYLDGELTWKGDLKPDAKVLLEEYLKSRDRKQLWTNRLVLDKPAQN